MRFDNDPDNLVADVISSRRQQTPSTAKSNGSKDCLSEGLISYVTNGSSDYPLDPLDGF